MFTNKRMLFVLMIVVLVLPALAILPSVGAQERPKPEAVGLRPDAPPYALHGPYWVGTREFVIEPDSERPLPLTGWYPALNPEGEREEVTYNIGSPPYPVIGAALLDAPADTEHGPYPLVVFSHGNAGTRLANVFFAEHLASHGFVVLASDHTGNTMADSSLDTDYFLVYRPLDITRVIDYAEAPADDLLSGLIDADHIAVSGHSFGGLSALQAAGAQLDFDAFDTLYCSKVRSGNMTDSLGQCATLAQDELQVAEAAGLAAVPQGLWPSWGDPRVDAAVAFAPGGGEGGLLLFGDKGLENATVPMLVVGGSGDTWAPPESNAYWAYDHVGSAQKSLVVLEGADHFIFQVSCEAVPWLAEMAFFACSDMVWDMDRAHDLINHFTTAFLLATLKGDQDAAADLAPDAVAFPGITYEAQGY